MSRSIKPRFKCLVKLRENIWNTSKPLKFNTLKWRRIKRNLFNRHYSKLKKIKFFSKKLYMTNFFRFRLDMKKIFFSMYGKYKTKKFSYLIKKFSHKGSLIKAQKYLFNKTVLGHYEVNNLLYLMQMFESKLIVSLFRFGFFDTIHSTVHFIRLGGALINGKVKKNPFYSLKEGDIISINRKFFYSILIFKNILKINRFKKRRYYFKRLPGIFHYKVRHIIYWYKKFKYIYSHNPQVFDLDRQKYICWDLVVYLIKLKRL